MDVSRRALLAMAAAAPLAPTAVLAAEFSTGCLSPGTPVAVTTRYIHREYGLGYLVTGWDVHGRSVTERI